MKIRIIILLAVNLFFTASKAQVKNNAAYYKGSSVVSVGYGIGNIWKTFLNDAVNSTIPGITYKVTAFGPIALNYEYGFLNRFSGGITFAYSKVKGVYSGFGDSFTDELKITTILARANYHFGRSPKFDPYIGGGMGYVKSKYNNDQSASRNDVPGLLGYSAQLGGRYYFTPVLGTYAEIGYVNGSFVQVGLTARF